MKCTPAMRASVVTTRSVPSVGAMTAASSSKRSAPGYPCAKGANSRAMTPSSPGRSGSAMSGTGEFRRPELARDGIENAVHHARLVAAEEGMGHIQIFVDDHLGRNIEPLMQLI